MEESKTTSFSIMRNPFSSKWARNLLRASSCDGMEASSRTDVDCMYRRVREFDCLSVVLAVAAAKV